MESKKMFSDAKEGDRVWSVRRGWGEIVILDLDSPYPIDVEFQGMISDYTLEGKCHEADKYPEIYWDEIKFEAPERPKKKVKKELMQYVNIYPVLNEKDFFIVAAPTAEQAEKNADYKMAIAIAIPIKIEFEIEE